VANGITPLLSIDANTSSGTAIRWSAIASGQYDSTIVSQADGLAALGSPVILSFTHEPELETANGNAADFVAAWRHYVTVFRRHGASNVSFAPILLAKTYDPTTIRSWYPGDAYVDLVGADGYNGFNCENHGGGWTDFSTIFSPLNSFAVAHSKPAVIAEWGSVEDPSSPGRKAHWISAAAATMQAWPNLKGSAYFDAPSSTPSCVWNLDSSASSMAAFTSLGSQQWFNPVPHALLSASIASGGAPMTVTFNGAGSQGVAHPIASWQIEFGDGSSPAGGNGMPPAAITHTYAAGTYVAALTVTDTINQSSSFSVTLAAYPPPSVSAGSVYGSLPTALTFRGTVSPSGADTHCHFEWGTTPAYGWASRDTDIGTGTSTHWVSYVVTGLAPGTLYHWRLVATNVAGRTMTPTQTATTPGAVPGVYNLSADITSPTRASLTAMIDPHELATTWYFEYGTTTAYGSDDPAPPASAGSGTTGVGVQVTLADLAPSTVYYYTLVAVNQLGTTIAQGRQFKTT
jgi:hypothetical protein